VALLILFRYFLFMKRFIPKFPELADNTLQMLTYEEIQGLPVFAELFPNRTLTITV
jgi:hypothetical protein